MKVHVITIFDKNYLGRALAFRDSFYRHAPAQHVHFLCLDEACHETAKKLVLTDTTIIRAEDLNDPELLASRGNRTLPEFASTCKPAYLLYMMKSGKIAKDDLLVFIDPDFALYSPADDLWKKMYASGSIIITPHRFPERREHEQFKKGVYNAGIVAFRNDDNALACLSEWRKQCIDWCYLRYENGMIADQGYMSSWLQKYKGVYEMRDKGVNLANWNIENYTIRKQDSDYLIDDEQLILYHFHGVRLYEAKNGDAKVLPGTIRHNGIYGDYESLLQAAYEKIRSIEPSWNLGLLPHPGFLRLAKQKIQRLFTS